MGRAVLAAAVALPREGDPNSPQGINEALYLVRKTNLPFTRRPDALKKIIKRIDGKDTRLWRHAQHVFGEKDKTLLMKKTIHFW